MTLSSLLLDVLASFIHASWNLLAKRAAPVGPLLVFAYNLVACVAYAPRVLYVLAEGTIPWTAEDIGFVLLSGIIHLAYSLCLQRGYQVADLSVVYPVARGTGPMLSTIGAILILAALTTGAPLSLVARMREKAMMVGALMGMLILRETVGPWRLAGCAVLIGGVMMLSIS